MPDPNSFNPRILDYLIGALFSILSWLGVNTMLRVNRLDREALTRTEAETRLQEFRIDTTSDFTDVKSDIRSLRIEIADNQRHISSRLDDILGKVSKA
jgi:hypothetical protein